MKKTANLELPIYDNPEVDVFNLEDWNIANQNLDNAFGALAEDGKLDIINSEVVDARKGKNTLKEKIDEIDTTTQEINSQLEQKAQKIDLESTNNKLFTKAEKESVSNLQGQINSLVLQASGTDITEVVQSRISGNGTTHKTLSDSKKFVENGNLTIKDLSALNNGYRKQFLNWEIGAINGGTGQNWNINYVLRTPSFIDGGLTLFVKIATGYRLTAIKFNSDNSWNSYKLYDNYTGNIQLEDGFKYKFTLAKLSGTDEITDVSSFLENALIVDSTDKLPIKEEVEKNTIDIYNNKLEINNLKAGYSLFDNWEIGGIAGNTGLNVGANFMIRSKDFIEPISFITFEVANGYDFFILEYDSDKIIQKETIFKTNGKFETKPNSFYKFKVQKNGSTVQIANIEELSKKVIIKYNYSTIFQRIKNHEERILNLEENIGNVLLGKTWNAVGDSITKMDLYVTDVANNLGLVATRYGVIGSTISINPTSAKHIVANGVTEYGNQTSIYERVLSGNMTEADIWTVFGGTNDWYYNSTLGTIDDINGNTIYGALNGICEYILTRPNRPKLILFTPLQANRSRYGGGTITYLEIRQAIIDIGIKYSVPVLDLYSIGGLNQLNVKDSIYPTTSDGVHPNTYGKNMYTPKIEKALKELSFRDVI